MLNLLRESILGVVITFALCSVALSEEDPKNFPEVDIQMAPFNAYRIVDSCITTESSYYKRRSRGFNFSLGGMGGIYGSTNGAASFAGSSAKVAKIYRQDYEIEGTLVRFEGWYGTVGDLSPPTYHQREHYIINTLRNLEPDIVIQQVATKTHSVPFSVSLTEGGADRAQNSLVGFTSEEACPEQFLTDSARCIVQILALAIGIAPDRVGTCDHKKSIAMRTYLGMRH